MEISSALLALCAGNSPITSEFPLQRPVTQSFDVFFDHVDLRLNKRSSKQTIYIYAADLRRHRVHYDVAVMCVGLVSAKRQFGAKPSSSW